MNLLASEFFKRLYTSIALIGTLGSAYYISAYLFSAILLAALLFVLCVEWPRLISPHSTLFILVTPIYPTIPMVLLIGLTLIYRTHDPLLPLFPFIIAWTADTCGYLVGKLCGKHKMCPSISPGKSWEGFTASCIGVIGALTVAPYGMHTLRSIPVIHNPVFIIIGGITLTSIAFLGGLFLSFLKRKAGLKDSGNLLPGHGGILDRIDAVLFVTIVFATALVMLQ